MHIFESFYDAKYYLLYNSQAPATVLYLTGKDYIYLSKPWIVSIDSEGFFEVDGMKN